MNEQPDDAVPEVREMSDPLLRPGVSNPGDGTPAADHLDSELTAAGERLREEFTPLDPEALRARALFGGGFSGGPVLEAGSPERRNPDTDRRLRRARVLAIAASLVAVIGLAGMLVAINSSRQSGNTTSDPSSGQDANSGDGNGVGEVRAASPAALSLVSKLPAAPVDPTKVELVSTVNSYDSCEALLGNLREIGAAHVGSGGFNGSQRLSPVADQARAEAAALSDAKTGFDAAPAGETVGTNIQVAGVDEPDVVKAVGTVAYDIRNNRLRIIDTRQAKLVGSVEFDGGDSPGPRGGLGIGIGGGGRSANVDSLLVSGTQVVAFGTESVMSEPIEGDTTAATAVHNYLTVTMVDVSNPAAPTVTDRVRIDGYLVSARLVDGTVRMVTGSYLSNIGFVMPTSPESIPKALETNRISVADSRIEDWIPQFERTAGEREPLIPCDRVNVPETFAGVAMTSMVQFAASGRFEASATGLLAPSSNIYATADKVTITAGIWVDPNVASNQVFTDWKTAIHQFAFGPQAPAYTGSATVDGAVANQFAFGEVGDRLAVVSTAGTPWMFEPNSRVDMTLFDQAAAPVGTGRLEYLGNGGWVAGVRFTESRAVVSTSNPSDLTQESQLRIIDLTNPDAPVAGATVPTSFSAEYLHPIDATNFIALGSFSEDGPNGPRTVSGVRATLVSTADPAAPNVSTAWTETNAMTSATSDHHEFLWWASAKLAALPLTRWSQDPPQPPPAAAFLGVDGGIDRGRRSRTVPGRARIRDCRLWRGADGRRSNGAALRRGSRVGVGGLAGLLLLGTGGGPAETVRGRGGRGSAVRVQRRRASPGASDHGHRRGHVVEHIREFRTGQRAIEGLGDRDPRRLTRAHCRGTSPPDAE
jgi:uncharacterized secreted protein with C-terminal beta-propeller domain